ncbi:UDP-N-acetylmuramate dehydrogenase [Mycolicibacterium sp. F2034L]|uniref:UDP-N-acetylmuramate dehydrogenase n=1 Tax=Mycolicibacterium sp. F2034L TaxID=2926422 RepID=UPI001FF63679|nr:UDP-N-acetylmuramate dehydrogenase [Mycolicibacterium sp. F2034L]MCK0175725.1 UDP-N-acetylmuramate dehydrogenase [Mycolicibacterium sp. F2034L]
MGTGGQEFAGAAIEHDVPLAPLTTLRVGPVAATLVTATSTEQLVAALRAPATRNALVLAGGSNVLLSDDLTDLTVIRVLNTEISVHDGLVRAEAGASWDDVVVTAQAHGLGGLECLSGIPGSAGATPVQNVGAYGAEVADTIRRVRLFDRRTGADEWVGPEHLGFGYRTSVLKRSSHAVVLEVEFALDTEGRSAPMRYGELARALDAAPGSRVDPVRVREAVLALRAGKGMVLDDNDRDTWSVGSFFTNPVVPEAEFERIQRTSDGPVPRFDAPGGVKLAAGWLVEHAGFGKGFPGDGAPARLSTKHALALTNRGGATSADVLDLARTVRAGVRDVFGVDLVPEPVLIGCAL